MPHIPETVLSVMLKENKVMFTSPGDDKYCNILFLNQNRSKSERPSVIVPSIDIHFKNLPKFFDYYIWSHHNIETFKVEKIDRSTIISIPSVTISSLRFKELTSKSIVIIDFFKSSEPDKKVDFRVKEHIIKMRPIITMNISSTYIDINNPVGKGSFSQSAKQLRSDKEIEKQVINRIGAYYNNVCHNVEAELPEELADFDIDNHQQDSNIPRPIFRVFIKNTEKKFLSLKPIEQKLEGLVANEG